MRVGASDPEIVAPYSPGRERAASDESGRQKRAIVGVCPLPGHCWRLSVYLSLAYGIICGDYAPPILAILPLVL